MKVFKHIHNKKEIKSESNAPDRLRQVSNKRNEGRKVPVEKGNREAPS